MNSQVAKAEAFRALHIGPAFLIPNPWDAGSARVLEWQFLLAVALGVNAILGLGYRIHRLAHGGPRADVIGQAVLAVVLLVIAVAVASGTSWGRWAALAYGVFFGLVVFPVWTLAVLIPLRPGAVDKTFASVYWLTLAVIAVAAVAL